MFKKHQHNNREQEELLERLVAKYDELNEVVQSQQLVIRSQQECIRTHQELIGALVSNFTKLSKIVSNEKES